MQAIALNSQFLAQLIVINFDIAITSFLLALSNIYVVKQILGTTAKFQIQDDGIWQTDKQKITNSSKQMMLDNFKGSLYIENNQCKYLLNELAECKFSSLIKLSIEGNMIETLNMLQTVKLNSLKFLYLGDNYICNIASLRKLMIPNITLISLRKNFIKQFAILQELFSKLLETLNLEWYGDTQTCADTKWVVKLESFCSFKLKSLQIRAIKRMIKKYLLPIYRNKNKDFKIFYFEGKQF